ncbi:hypothetical protein [Dyella flagellata]|uniref:hypothetical protein n=1 Tax=Dyella flagellata TaxID=1867833 RepID=UPI0024E0F121|nr:hypothetical protein [Dyella flagellata]
MVKNADNPGATPIEIFDDLRQLLAANRAQFFISVPAGPFYGFNRSGAQEFSRNHKQLVAAGHDGQREGSP